MNLIKNYDPKGTIVTEGLVTRVRTFGIQDVSHCGDVNDVLTHLDVGNYSKRNISDVCPNYSVISDDLGNPLTIVNESYDLLQPVEAFSFFDALQGELGFDYTQAGFLDEGRKMFISGNIGDIEVVSKKLRKVGDVIQKRLTAWTSFDGSKATSIRLQLLRLWCDNGCATWESDGAIARVKHTASQRPRLTQAIEQATGIRQVFQNLEDDIAILSATEVTEEQMKEMALRVFPNDTKQSESARDSVLSQFSNERLGAFGETGWDAMNAFTAHLNHNRNSRQTEGTTREENDFLAVSDSGRFVQQARQAIDAVLKVA
jgi:phage/plasmid-like protein (TIGR03299 family)